MLAVDTEINDETRNILNASKSLLLSDVKDKIKSDFQVLYDLGLLSAQLDAFSSFVEDFIKMHDDFISVINSNKIQWEETVDKVDKSVDDFSKAATKSNKSSRKRNGGGGGGGSHGTDGGSADDVDHGVEIKPVDVKAFVQVLTDSTLCTLLAKIYKLYGKSITELLVDQDKSGILVAYIRKLFGESGTDTSRTSETDEIQKELIKKLGINPENIKTDEDIKTVEKKIVEKIEKAPKDEEDWDRAVYGNKTKTMTVEAGGSSTNYIVVDSKISVNDYVSYIKSAGSHQSANSEWKNNCLSFAETYAYDLYKGTKTEPTKAATYKCGGSFNTVHPTTEEETLQVIYNELINGKPCVLQVNSGPSGKVRHFVTVVGFKKGAFQSNITQKDLLIIDCADGKISRMDLAGSRFMTTGEDCDKDYKGYYVRTIAQD